MSSEGGVMEKHLSRQAQGQFKGNGGVAERRNDFTPNRNGRQRRGKVSAARPLEPPMPTTRSMQKWTKSSNDKRPRQRGYLNDRSREEVAEEEDLSLENEPLYDSTSRKGNGNHLLSFQYERRGAQNQRHNSSHYKGPTRPPSTYKTKRYNKEQFLQASFQFVVRDNVDGDQQYAEQMINPDALVNWDMVELVRGLATEEVICSICLMPPMAGKLTKCGHTFCWACILHYLSTNEKVRHDCPLCNDPIASEEFKSIHHVPVPQFKEGDKIEMKLMKKNKGFVYVCPRAIWKETKGKHLNIHDGEMTAFNKVLLATSEQIYADVIEGEKAALSLQLAEAEDYEKGYIDMAMDLLRRRELDLKQRIRTNSESGATTQSQECEMAISQVESLPLASDQSFDGSKIATTYSDAFQNEKDFCEPCFEEGRDRQVSVGEESIPFETMHSEDNGHEEESQSVGDSECASDETSQSLDSSEIIYEEELWDKVEAMGLHTDQPCSLELPKSTMTACEAADHLELPQTTPTRRANYSKDVYYFYQASTSQHIYLNSLNVQCLVKEYGSLEDSPDIITGKVVAVDRIFITEEMRKRFRYLSHIPLTTEIQIVELKLESPTISKETQKHFHEAFEKRKKMRQRKLKAEKARAKKIEAQERKNAQDLYQSYTIVKSDQFSPVNQDFLAVEATDTLGASSPPLGEISTGLTAEGGSATKSFAQIIKRGNTMSKSTSPSVSAWPARPTGPPAAQASSPQGQEEEGRAPSYATSMFKAWGKVNFEAPSKGPSESSCPSPPAAQTSGGKKKKKKEGMTMLFSTGMARRI